MVLWTIIIIILHAQFQRKMNVWSRTTKTASIRMILAFNMGEDVVGFLISAHTNSWLKITLFHGYLSELCLYDFFNNKVSQNDSDLLIMIYMYTYLHLCTNCCKNCVKSGYLYICTSQNLLYYHHQYKMVLISLESPLIHYYWINVAVKIPFQDFVFHTQSTCLVISTFCT